MSTTEIYSTGPLSPQTLYEVQTAANDLPQEQPSAGLAATYSTKQPERGRLMDIVVTREQEIIYYSLGEDFYHNALLAQQEEQAFLANMNEQPPVESGNIQESSRTIKKSNIEQETDMWV